MNELYITCKVQGCPLPIQGMISLTALPRLNTYNFKGVCWAGHMAARSLAREYQDKMRELGWISPEVGKSNAFMVPVVEARSESVITVSVPNDPEVELVIVNVKTGAVTPLPGAVVTLRLNEDNKLVEWTAMLGEPTKNGKISKKALEAVAESEERNAFPFVESSAFYDMATILRDKGKISLDLANKKSSKLWDEEHYIQFFEKKGWVLTFNKGFLHKTQP